MTKDEREMIKELKDWKPDDSLYESEWDLNSDDYTTKIDVEIKQHTSGLSIQEYLDGMSMISKLTPAVAKLDTLNKEELEIAKEKIINYQGYSQTEKNYLINKIHDKLI